MKIPEESGSGGKLKLLPAYVADLEFEVDRLRKQHNFLAQRVDETLRRVDALCGELKQSGQAAEQVRGIDDCMKQLAAVVADLPEAAEYMQDQVVPIAVRPMIEQVFRWQQRLTGVSSVKLELNLECEQMEWFPGRLRHIADNLISNSIKYRDSDKQESWVRVGLRAVPNGYELSFSDNGTGMPYDDQSEVLDLFYRASPARAAGLGVGLAVVKLLLEQSGGRLAMDSGEGQGTTLIAFLPRFDLNDYLA